MALTPAKDIKYAFFDLDGTLLNGQNVIGAPTLKAVADLKAAGVKIGIVSGRSNLMITEFADQIKPDLPIVAINGALISDDHHDFSKPVAEVPIDPELAVKVAQRLIDDGFSFMYYLKDRMIVYWHDHDPEPAWVDRWKHTPKQFMWRMDETRTADALRGTVGYKFFIRVKGVPPEKLAAFVKWSFGLGDYHCFQSMVIGYDFMTTSVSKGTGLQKLHELGVIDLAHTLAIGDEVNDVPVFKVVARSVAMKNASDTVKQSASEVTRLTNVDEGVADFIRTFIAERFAKDRSLDPKANYKKIKYIYSDVDGTLIDGNHELAPATVAVIKKLKDAGFKFGMITGRPNQLMKREIRLAEPNLPTVTMNGGLVSSVDQNWHDALVANYLGKDDLKRVLEYLFKNQATFLLYRRDYLTVYRPRKNSGETVVVEFTASITDPRDAWDMREVRTIEEVGEEPAHKIFIVGHNMTNEQIAELESMIDHSSGLTRVKSQEQCIDVIPPLSSKGDALSLLDKQGVIKLSETMVFGDQENDIPMLRLAGHSVAMKNASDHVKEESNEVTEFTNFEDGLAKFLENFLKAVGKAPN